MNAKARHRENRTRNLIVQAAFEEIWRVGFRSASLEAILKRAKVTKGALYHYFPNKQALGYAVVDEYIRWLIYDDYLRPLVENESDPIEALNSIVRARNRSAKHSDTTHDYSINVLGVNAIRLGCPLNNLAQEMSPLDEEFRKKIQRVFDMWQEGLAKALRRGQAARSVSQNIDPDTTAVFLIAVIEGTIGIAKNAQRTQILSDSLDKLLDYINTLRHQSN